MTAMIRSRLAPKPHAGSAATERASVLPRYLAVAYLVLVVYASLHPFSGWRDTGLSPTAFLDAAWPRYWTVFDLATNVLAYLPLGFLLALTLSRIPGRLSSAFVATLLASLISFSLECLQTWLPSRVPSNLDLASNMLGATIGALLAVRHGEGFFRRLASLQRRLLAPVPHADLALVMLGLWLLTQLSPETLLFGAGDLRHLLGLSPAVPYAAPSFFVIETLIIVSNTIAIGLIARTLLADRSSPPMVLAVFCAGAKHPGAGCCRAGQPAGCFRLADSRCRAWSVDRVCGSLADAATATLATPRTGRSCVDGRYRTRQPGTTQSVFSSSTGHLAAGSLSQFQRPDTTRRQRLALSRATLSDHAWTPALARRQRPQQRRHLMPKKFLGLIFAVALLGACATVKNPVSGENELTVMDEQSEIALGRKEHAEVLKEYGIYNNPRLQTYVNELGQRLASQSHRKNLEWHFTVLDSPQINAFALPGGYVYVTRGIMAYMDSEADLAGVIGHEIGHVTARHGAQRATRQQTAGIGVLAASILGAILESNGVSGAGQLASQASQGLAAGYIASYGRDQELQADSLGAEYLSRVNLDPKNMVDVIGVLKNQERFADDAARAEGRTPPPHTGWLASHPSNDKRLQDIVRIAGQYKGNYGDEGRSRYLQAINGMTFGESRDQGVTRGRHFYHEPLGIALTAPEGWKIRNTPEAIALINAPEDAGLIVSVLPAKAGNTQDEIVRNVFRSAQGRTERRSLGGFPATHFVGTRQNQQGQMQPIEATVVTGPENRNYLLVYGAKNSQVLQQARGKIQEGEASFRPLNSADHAAARPWTIRTLPYRHGSLPQLVRDSPLSGNAEQQLRLLNGVYSGGDLQTGQLIKVVE